MDVPHIRHTLVFTSNVSNKKHHDLYYQSWVKKVNNFLPSRLWRIKETGRFSGCWRLLWPEVLYQSFTSIGIPLVCVCPNFLVSKLRKQALQHLQGRRRTGRVRNGHSQGKDLIFETSCNSRVWHLRNHMHIHTPTNTQCQHTIKIKSTL